MAKNFSDAQLVEISKCIRHNTSLEWLFKITKENIKEWKAMTDAEILLAEALRYEQIAESAKKNAAVFREAAFNEYGIPNKPKETKGQMKLF